MSKYKKGKSLFMSPKDKYKKVMLPSTLEYKDTTKKFSNVHTYESFIVTMYNSLCSENNSIVDVLINDNYKIPELQSNPTNEQLKDHSKFYGESILTTNVKAIISSVYAKLCDEYQQRVNSEYPALSWMLIRSVDEVKKFIAFIKK